MVQEEFPDVLVEGLSSTSSLQGRLGEAGGAVIIESGHELIQLFGFYPLGAFARHMAVFAGLDEISPWGLLLPHEVAGNDDGLGSPQVIPLSSPLFTPSFPSLRGSLGSYGRFCSPVNVAIPRYSSLWC